MTAEVIAAHLQCLRDVLEDTRAGHNHVSAAHVVPDTERSTHVSGVHVVPSYVRGEHVASSTERSARSEALEGIPQ